MGDVNMSGRGPLHDFANLAMDVAYYTRRALEEAVGAGAKIVRGSVVVVEYLAAATCSSGYYGNREDRR